MPSCPVHEDTVNLDETIPIRIKIFHHRITVITSAKCAPQQIRNAESPH